MGLRVIYNGTMTAEPIDDNSDISTWLRPAIDEPANVLLIGSQNGGTTQEICQDILTTVSLRQETILAVGYGTKENTWLKDIDFIPSNLTVEWCDDKHSNVHKVSKLSDIIDSFLSTPTSSHPIVYIDSLTFLFVDTDFVMASNICQDLTQQLHSVKATGFFRIDPTMHNQREIESIAKHFDYIAEFIPNSKMWKVDATVRDMDSIHSN